MCNTSRWKDSNTLGKKVPKKVLRYFLIIPKLQRLYKSSHTAMEMTWHATRKCKEPGKMQYPVDGRAWKNFDTKYLDFAKEPRNTLLIPGPKSPGKYIDVYLRPLIDDLKDLWALKEDRKKFCQFIKGVKLPDGFGSNFKHKVTDNDTNITGLKSHDCHIMMQRLLPYGLQQYLPPDIAKPLIELCLFFKQICSQTLMVDDMLKAQSKVIDILCNLELIYPPTFFDIMIHLVIHLPLEAIFGGPIRPRWMYPFERYMKKLKNYVQNKAKPKGSIAEGYVAEEALTFSSHYFRDVTMKFNHPDRNVDCPPPTCQFQVFKSLCKSIGLRSVIRIDHQELKKVIWYVLHNSPEIDTYQAKFKSLNDLEIAALHIDGQSIDVDALLDIIDVVDEDDDIIDEEDPFLMIKAALRKWYWILDRTDLRPGSASEAHNPRHSEMESSTTREYPSLIHTFFLTHTIGGVFLNPGDKALYMVRLQGLGSNTETAVPYTEDEIMAIFRGGKQRGHIPGVGKVLSGQGTLFRSDDKFSQMLTQLESQPEIGGGSGSGGCGDDEPGDDEDATRMGRMRTIVRRCWVSIGYFVS
ncbi:pyruvate kinase [Tanacetum coccineum]